MEMKIFNEEAGYCPYCHSMDIEYGNYDMDSNYLFYNCQCNECKGKWTEDYKLAYEGKTVSHGNKKLCI